MEDMQIITLFLARNDLHVFHRGIQQRLAKFPVTDSEWRNYVLDQRINDRGIRLDLPLVETDVVI